MINISQDFWEQFLALPTPSVEETIALGQIDPSSSALLDEDGRPSMEYIKVQKLYRMLVSALITARSGLEQLDDRLFKEGFRPRSGEDMDYYQRYDLMGLRFFYLRSFVHVERLTPQEAKAFEDCVKNQDRDSAFAEALNIVNETYRKVLERSPAHPERHFELFPNIHGNGIISGDTITLALCSEADYDEAGMLRDEQADQRRVNVFWNVQRQLETIMQKALETRIFVMVEV